jgi:hypothetical protein
MATQVGRSLSEIDSKVRQLSLSIKESTKKTKELDRTLKLDPSNTRVAAQQMRNLATQIGQATQKVALLRQRKAEANRELQQGNITADEYKKIEQAVESAEMELQRFNAQLKNTKRQQVQVLAGRFDRVARSMQQAQRVARTFSRLMMGLVGIMAAAVTVFTRHATQLAEVAREYELCVERLQVKKGVFEQVTGSAENYTRSLDRLRSRLNQITFGTGIAYERILTHIGVASRDAEGRTRSLGEVYDEVIIALREMDDMMLRNRLAYELFGEEAIHIIEILELTQEEYEMLMEQQLEANIINEEQILAAQAIQEAWDEVRKEFMAAGAELSVSLLPLIQAMTELLRDHLIPLLTAIANWFNNMSPVQQAFVIFLIFLIILLPKIIAFVKVMIFAVKGLAKGIKKLGFAKKKAAVGAAALSKASMPLQPILLAVAAVILILATLFMILTGQSRRLSGTLDQQRNSLNGLGAAYEDLGGGLEMQMKQVCENNHNSNVNVSIEASGDTPISQENAQQVADLLAERINRELGGKI